LIADHLQFIAKKEKITLEAAAAHAIARGAEGGLRDAESMLDQLVAFCGENISESDVLNVFGFTSEQTMVDLTGKILHGEAAGALDVLYEQCEAGKDMMRLMSDLISYLRDLLVFKAKPDALQQDVDPELQKALAAQSELIQNDRLLDLIDQFAQAEGRMKWAPNKKLHFEVAIIKAIQSLNQATLDEVIAKLGELRDGKSVAEKKTSVAKTVAAGNSQFGSDSVPSRSSAAKTAAPTSPRVAESPDGNIWQRAYAKIPTQKAFVRNSAAVAHVLPSDGRHFVLGFSPDQKSPMGILGTATNRKLIETLLREVSGKDWTLKLTVRENLPSNPQSSGKSPSENYADDPLIREALEIFKGELKR
jgi:DNA polymerase III gamma/tau subunit